MAVQEALGERRQIYPSSLTTPDWNKNSMEYILTRGVDPGKDTSARALRERITVITKVQHLKRAVVAGGVIAAAGALLAQDSKRTSSYSPVVIQEEFATTVARMKAAKPEIMQRQQKLLEERYDMRNNPVSGVTMSKGKALQGGVRARLASGMTWERLAQMTPEQVRERDVFPAGFMPLPHPNHPEGGMVFPKFHIDEIKKQEIDRDLTRFDLDFDLPDHFLPEFPPPIFLTTRPDLGDVSQGKLVTIENFYELFNGILNPKQLEGVRLLVSPFPQQQFNQTRGPPHGTREPRRHLL